MSSVSDNFPVLLSYSAFLGTTAFSTTRQGGALSNNYAAFSINRYCGDSEAHIALCRAALCRRLAIDDDRLIMPHQTHSTNVVIVDEALMRADTATRTAMLEDKDALITRLKGICIGVSTADCIPVLLYDEQHHVAAAVHAGWRGTMARIVSHTVHQLIDRYDTDPEHIKAVIGPGISPEAFEVGDEVYEAFREAHFPMSAIATRLPAAGGGTKWHIDLWQTNRMQLTECGVKEANIRLTGICTRSNAELFFSARKLTIDSGRIFTGIMI